MENMMKVSTELGYMKVPKGVLMDITKIKGLPKNKQVIVTTGSQGEEMSALYRMAFTTHKQVEIGPGDKVIISASAMPGNEVEIGRVINELFRKGANVIYDRADMLHVSGHACQEELKIIHALTKPRFFIPLHGEQRMLQIHASWPSRWAWTATTSPSPKTAASSSSPPRPSSWAGPFPPARCWWTAPAWATWAP
jgi:ribonuclease J